jgi:hypothetical protein
VTVSNPRCGWSGNPAGAETAGVCLAEQQISSMGMGLGTGRATNKSLHAHRRTRPGRGTGRSTAARTCERTQGQVLISRQGKKWMATEAHLPMLRRTTAPRPSYCGRARNLRTTCRGCFSSIFPADLCLLPEHLCRLPRCYFIRTAAPPFTEATARFPGSALSCVSR